MRTILCRQCLEFITVDSTFTRDVLGAGRNHVADNPATHRKREVVFVDLDTTARILVNEALGAKARR